MATSCPYYDPGTQNQSVKTDLAVTSFAGTFGVSANDSAILGGPLSATGGGGRSNCICSPGYLPDGNIIVGGLGNLITDNGSTGPTQSFIGGGTGNKVTGFASSIVGGETNTAISDKSFVGGGSHNNVYIASDCSFIGGGTTNSIGDSSVGGTSPAIFSFIGGGSGNCIDSVGSGSAYGTIGGGKDNCIFPGTSHSSIFSGDTNSVSGSCSSILGGSNNNDGGFAFVGMYGNTLTATKSPASYGVPSAFWVDSLVAPSIPLVTILTYPNLPVGALYITAAGGFGVQQVFVK